MACCQSLAARRFLLWYILIISLVVLPLSWDVLMGCNMIVVGPVQESRQTMKGLGFFSNSIYDDETGAILGCVRYSQYLSDQTEDIGFRLARIFAALLGTFITLATFICLLVQCFNKHGKTCMWALMTWSYVAAFLCQGGVFLIMMADVCDQFEGEDSQCRLGNNGIISIVNGVLLFGMVIATCNSSPPRNPVFRCWYATDEECNTDESDKSQENVRDVENPKNAKSESGSRKRRSDDNESVSLFSSNRSNHSKKSWLSLGPKLTVREQARKLEGKNLWPMNQMKSGGTKSQPDTKSYTAKQGTSEPMVDPRVQTYYRTQRSIFKRFENDTLKQVDTMKTASGSLESSKSDESLKKTKATTARDFLTRDSRSESTAYPSATDIYPKPSYTRSEASQPIIDTQSSRFLTKTASLEGEEGVETPLAHAYLRHIRTQQSDNTHSRAQQTDNTIIENEEAESIKSGESVKSGSIKSGSIKSDSVKSGSIKSGSAKSGSVKSGSAKKGSIKSGSVKSHESSSIHSASTASTFLVQQLAQSVILGKGGVRKEKTTIGKTMKIVDEYPAPAGMRKNGSKNSGAPIVKVRTEYCPEGRKTVMDELCPDGSRVVTTLIDPLTIDEQLGL